MRISNIQIAAPPLILRHNALAGREIPKLSGHSDTQMGLTSGLLDPLQGPVRILLRFILNSFLWASQGIGSMFSGMFYSVA